MSGKEEYGLEDVCTCLDAIEVQLKRLVSIQKIHAQAQHIYSITASQRMEIEQI